MERVAQDDVRRQRPGPRRPEPADDRPDARPQRVALRLAVEPDGARDRAGQPDRSRRSRGRSTRGAATGSARTCRPGERGPAGARRRGRPARSWRSARTGLGTRAGRRASGRRCRGGSVRPRARARSPPSPIRPIRRSRRTARRCGPGQPERGGSQEVAAADFPARDRHGRLANADRAAENALNPDRPGQGCQTRRRLGNHLVGHERDPPAVGRPARDVDRPLAAEEPAEHVDLLGARASSGGGSRPCSPGGRRRPSRRRGTPATGRRARGAGTSC